MPKFGVFEIGPDNTPETVRAGKLKISVDVLQVLPPSIGALQLVETLEAVKRSEDWSKVRSPARARRRLKQGHRQNIVHLEEPCAYEIAGVMYCHPEIMRRIENDARIRIDRELERMKWGAIFGGPGGSGGHR